MKETYYDFAENDYKLLLHLEEQDQVWNSMCSIAQQTCERFLKHLISEYYQASSDTKKAMAEDVLKTHSLKKIEKFLTTELGLDIPEDLHKALSEVNGFYFETRYPGDDSFFADKDDVKEALNAVHQCKQFTDRIIQIYNDPSAS